jgi:hypothetical protein
MKNASTGRPPGDTKLTGDPHGCSLLPGLLVPIFCLLAQGCTTAPATQTVYVPVHTPCVKESPAQPVYEFEKLPLYASDGTKILALARDWTSGRKYEKELEAIVSGCS